MTLINEDQLVVNRLYLAPAEYKARPSVYIF